MPPDTRLRRNFLLEDLLQIGTEMTRLYFDVLVQLQVKKHLTR